MVDGLVYIYLTPLITTARARFLPLPLLVRLFLAKFPSRIRTVYPYWVHEASHTAKT